MRSSVTSKPYLRIQPRKAYFSTNCDRFIVLVGYGYRSVDLLASSCVQLWINY